MAYGDGEEEGQRENPGGSDGYGTGSVSELKGKGSMNSQQCRVLHKLRAVRAESPLDLRPWAGTVP